MALSVAVSLISESPQGRKIGPDCPMVTEHSATACSSMLELEEPNSALGQSGKASGLALVQESSPAAEWHIALCQPYPGCRRKALGEALQAWVEACPPHGSKPGQRFGADEQ